MHLRILDGAKKVNEEEEIESVRFWITDTLDGKEESGSVNVVCL